MLSRQSSGFWRRNLFVAYAAFALLATLAGSARAALPPDWTDGDCDCFECGAAIGNDPPFVIPCYQNDGQGNPIVKCDVNGDGFVDGDDLFEFVKESVCCGNKGDPGYGEDPAELIALICFFFQECDSGTDPLTCKEMLRAMVRIFTVAYGRPPSQAEIEACSRAQGVRHCLSVLQRTPTRRVTLSRRTMIAT